MPGDMLMDLPRVVQHDAHVFEYVIDWIENEPDEEDEVPAEIDEPEFTEV